MSDKAWRVVAFLILVVVVTAVFECFEPRYISPDNLSAIARHMAANGLAALGLTFVVVVRKFDLSFPGVGCFAAMTIGIMIASGFGLWASIGVGFAAAGVFGVVNGVAVSYFGLPDIVTTIATGSVAAGCAFLYSGGQTIQQNFFTSGIIDLNDSRLAGINISAWFLLVIYVLAFILLHRMRFGASFYAVGDNPVSALFSGVNVRLYRMLAFVISSLTVVGAVVLIVAEAGTADTNDGATFLMPAYASVYLGAALLNGTSIPATFAGTLLITMLLNGFSLLGVAYYYSDGVASLILLVGVAIFDERIKQRIIPRRLYAATRLVGRRAIP
jgi:ribose transport system permease protein